MATQQVQVSYKEGGRLYTYEYDDEALVLHPGDIVEVTVGRDGEEHKTQAMVEELGSSYTGPCKPVLGVLRQADPVWGRIKQFREALAIQTSDGNWNNDAYMHGMANGMIFADHCIRGEEGEPVYIAKPEQYLVDREDGEIDPADVAGVPANAETGPAA